MMQRRKTRRLKDQKTAPAGRELDGSQDAGADLLALQRSAGNRVVNQAITAQYREEEGPPKGVNAVLDSDSGQSLPDTARQEMEARFGRDFSQVRIHTGEEPAQSAEDLGAQAYTVGQHIVFGAGRYEPETPEGQELIAHELAHVAQQRQGGPPPPLNENAPHEQEAQAASQPVHSDKKAAGVKAATGVGIARQKKPDQPAGPVSLIPHSVDIKFYQSISRYVVTIDAIPVAEIDVESKDVPINLNVDIEGNRALITLRHYGNASIARVPNPGATLALSVELREVDLRQGPTGFKGSRVPPLPGESKQGFADIVIAPPSILQWPDEPRGELSLTSPLPPGSISEYEQKIRSGEGRVIGVVLDPENPGEVIGYRESATAGVTRLVDREGNEVFLSEVGLETPLLDPIDLVPTPGTVGKVGAGVAGKVGLKILGKKAAVKGTKVPLAIIARMRGVSRALANRALRKGAAEAPDIVRKITKAGLDHSFDRHAAQWFGRAVSRDTHLTIWRELIERATASRKVFPWSVGPYDTIGHLARIEGKYFVVQFYVETGELATAFVPNSSQLREMLKLISNLP